MFKRVRYIIMLVLLLSGTTQTLAQLAMPDQVCTGTTRRYWVTGTPGSTFTWKINGVMQSSTTDNLEVNWSATGIFKVEVQEHQAKCDGDIQEGIVTVVGLPILDKLPDVVACSSFTMPTISGTNLSGNEAYYDNSPTAGEIRITGPITESQTVWIYDETETEPNCFDQISFEVVIVDPPLIFAGNAANICSGTNLALLESTASNYRTLLWTSNGDGLFDDPVALHPVYTPGPNDIKAGNATLILTAQVLNPEANCPPDSSTVRITIHALPNLVITDPPATCATETVDLSAKEIVVGSDPDLEYTFWKDDKATILLSNYTAIDAEGIFYIKATNAAGCSVVGPVGATFSPVPKLVINNPDAVCKPATVDLSATSVTAGSEPGLSFSYWQDAAATIPLGDHKAIAASGIYYITATNAAGCSVTSPVRVIINEPIVPVFEFVKEFCQNSIAPGLPTRSDNEIRGTWNPAIISTTSFGKTNYTFTPDAGQCASVKIVVIDITDHVNPIFNIYTTYCQNSFAEALPAVSLNDIHGAWLPKAISTSIPGKSRYLFTPEPGQCGDTTSIVIRITDPVQPLFSKYNTLSLCRYSIAPVLPTVSDNGIRGTWLPAIISTDQAVTKTYNFTPDAGQCAKSFSSIVAVTQKDVPVFDGIGPFCLGSAPPSLPATSKNGISGTWIPSEITTVTSGKATYLFKPNDGECAEDAPLEIEIYNKIELDIKADPLLVYGGTTRVTVNATGGSGKFSSGIGLFDKGTGTHTFTVIDDAGCSGVGSIVVANPQDLVITTTVKPIECIGGYAVIEVTATGGTLPYSYSIAGGNWSTASLFTVPASAISYQFEVVDSKGLFGISQPIPVTDPPLIELAVSSTSPICSGGADGTATVVQTNGTSPKYLWNDPLKQTTAQATGLKAGKYTVEVTDANACNPVKAVVTVPEPPAITLAATGTDPTCPGANGSIRFELTNVRDGNYDILYDAGKFSSVQILGNSATVAAPAGIYTNLKLSLNGCSTANGISVNLKDAPELSITEVVTQPNCQTVTGRVVVTSPKENTGFVYSIDNGPYQVLATFSGLNPGAHMLKVKGSGSGCESGPKSIVIDPVPATPSAPTASITVQPDCIQSTGTMVVTVPNEASGFEYSINGGSWQPSATFTGLKPGSYQLKAKAMSTDCESGIIRLTVNPVPNPPVAPVASVTVRPTCNDPNGTVVVSNPKEDTGFEYSIDDGVYQTSASFALLKWGEHSIRIKNIMTECESVPRNVEVPAIPPAPILKIAGIEACTCYEGNGSISVIFTNVADGIYTIAYDSGQFSNVAISNNKAKIIAPAGTYQNLKIVANGCISGEDVDVIITQPDPIVITAAITEIDLKSQRKGAIDLTVTGGAGPGTYSFLWSYNNAATEDMKDLKEDVYSVTVTDKNGCSQSKSITIPVPNFPPVAVDNEYNVGCFGISENLLINDYDPDGDAIFIELTLVKSPVHGKVIINPDMSGSFEYMPEPGYTGPDGFQYVISDVKQNISNTASVILQIVPDFDRDGVPDNLDKDADGDGILNIDEGDLTLDTDSDGIPNYLDIDSDNDGIVDIFEAQSNKNAPENKDTDGDGLDDAFGTDNDGTKIVPVDTDKDGVPDFLDADSDNDLVLDYIEGHDENADGKPDYVLIGKDSDADGLDDGFDTVYRNSSPGNRTGSNAAMQDFDLDGVRDWRDNDDDDDNYLTRFEDLNADSDFINDDTDFDGLPEYLDNDRDCDLFIPEIFTPNDDNIHEYFQIYCIDHFPNARIYIFDSKGNKVYEKDHYGNLVVWGSANQAWWNGKTSNRLVATDRGMVPSGMYYYVLRLGNGEVKKSYVLVSY